MSSGSARGERGMNPAALAAASQRGAGPSIPTLVVPIPIDRVIFG
jgi:hypothetical protein